MHPKHTINIRIDSACLMNTKISVKNPMGAGGNWLCKTLIHYRFDQDRYHHFHSSPINCWVLNTHDLIRTSSYVTFSGKYKFNFFCNHVFKFYHLLIDQYQTSPYKTWFKETTASAFGLGKLCNQLKDPYFDFDDLLYEPDVFYDKIIELQRNHNQFVISKNYFGHARNLFLASCVNTSIHFNNFDSPWWTMFVLGQLMTQEIYPAFDIGDQNNFLHCKKFVRDNVHQCPEFYNWEHPNGVDMNISLPL